MYQNVYDYNNTKDLRLLRYTVEENHNIISI